MVRTGGMGDRGARTVTEADGRVLNLKSIASGGLANGRESATVIVAPDPRFNKALRFEVHVQPNLAPRLRATASENMEEHFDALTSWSKSIDIATPAASKLALAMEGGMR